MCTPLGKVCLGVSSDFSAVCTAPTALRSAATLKLAHYGRMPQNNLIPLRRRLRNANPSIMGEREHEFYGLITLRRTRRW